MAGASLPTTLLPITLSMRRIKTHFSPQSFLVSISVGRKPSTEFVKTQLNLDRSGYIIADETTRTNIPGVFAVGDVRTKALRQVVTAVSDGAVAAHYAEKYINENP